MEGRAAGLVLTGVVRERRTIWGHKRERTGAVVGRVNVERMYRVVRERKETVVGGMEVERMYRGVRVRRW